jgi:hypothetical protein
MFLISKPEEFIWLKSTERWELRKQLSDWMKKSGISPFWLAVKEVEMIQAGQLELDLERNYPILSDSGFSSLKHDKLSPERCLRAFRVITNVIGATPLRGQKEKAA